MGGFLIGSTCSAPSPPLHSSRLLPSPQSQFVLLCSSNAAKSKRRRPSSASLRCQDATHDAFSLKRRDFVLVGISLLPFLQLRSPALADESELLTLLHSWKNVIFHCRKYFVLCYFTGDDNEIKTSKLSQESEVSFKLSLFASSPFEFLNYVVRSVVERDFVFWFAFMWCDRLGCS